LTPVDSLHG